MPAIESSLTLIATAAFAALAAMSAALMPDAPTLIADVPVSLSTPIRENITVNINIIDDSKLRLISICGAIGGALVSVIVFHSKKMVARELAFKLLASALIGVLFTPAVMRYFNFTPDADTVLSVSASIALMGWSVLQVIVPILTRFSGRFISSKLDVPSND